MTGLQPVVIDGRQGTVLYVDEQWHPVEPDKATLAKVHFTDGKIVFYRVGPNTPTAEARSLYREDQERDEGGRFTYEGGGTGEAAGRFVDRETGGSPRNFTSEEGYQWHEEGPVAEWATTLPHADVKEINDYAGFGYGDMNARLRGQFTPRIVDEKIREATPAEIAAWEPSGNQHASDYDDADLTNKVPDGRIVRTFFYKGGYKPEGPNEQVESFHIERAGPDEKYVRELDTKSAKIDESIRERGYELPEPIVVNRAAYIPGMSYDELKASEGQVIEEKGFSSTMVGDAGKRLDGYVAHAKYESIYKRTGGKPNALVQHQDEKGAAMRIQIALPAGTKVSAVEPVRRLEHKFPRKQDPSVFEHPEWLTNKDGTPNGLKAENFTLTDFDATPTVRTDRLRDKSSRSEAEVLLGSGAKFRVVRVQRDGRTSTGDGSLKPVEIIDVRLEYLGGGSSEGRRR